MVTLKVIWEVRTTLQMPLDGGPTESRIIAAIAIGLCPAYEKNKNRRRQAMPEMREKGRPGQNGV